MSQSLKTTKTRDVAWKVADLALDEAIAAKLSAREAAVMIGAAFRIYIEALKLLRSIDDDE